MLQKPIEVKRRSDGQTYVQTLPTLSTSKDRVLFWEGHVIQYPWEWNAKTEQFASEN